VTHSDGVYRRVSVICLKRSAAAAQAVLKAARTAAQRQNIAGGKQRIRDGDSRYLDQIRQC